MVENMGRKVEIEIRENVLKFLEAFSTFSGRSPKEIIEEWIEKALEADLDCATGAFLGLNEDDLRERYGLQKEGI
ncbi:MAG: hypothetical protein NTX81_01285, partial [Candidatus Bathyarchaeota archaeon]|nr:hypothetical protein [Candidatus Bathyarchaeota archaeon]